MQNRSQKNSSKLRSVHWDLLESMQREADWIASRTPHDRLRPKYGYSAAGQRRFSVRCGG
ncbi:hypothetical protein L541_4483 [Bordetella hinzii CA90 BAL1384]|uniref:Uncharacterized protein n=1 Tax=Bordetella hinzii OH87 BAL007II TaxID=1331262 RepID=A0ABR4R3Y8_9BORD|nr:hypothetical protein L544_0840 [Bordetella hinzii OH87 BAL007II]KCB27298.1 hypothetical protein L541_4483 [Bordetella hinzii CA90 BAL1384]KCB30680.1 hypothetical protein L543_0840 [Bordetella hinzii L60]